MYKFFKLISIHFLKEWQGPKLRLPGRQCDQKFSSGDQNFVVGRQLVTGKPQSYLPTGVLLFVLQIFF